MKRTKSTYLALVAVLLSPMAANADLIEGLCSGGVDATVTCDESTNFEWLDLTETVGLSVNTFLANVGGWVSAGWMLATNELVDQLFVDAGATSTGGGNDAGNAPAVALLLGLLGDTGCRTGSGCSHGLADFDGAGNYNVPFFFNDYEGIYIASGTQSGFDADFTFDALGIFAYRASAVPEPGTLALFGLGLAAMGLSRRRKKI